jgi:retinol dehydrogenase-12
MVTGNAFTPAQDIPDLSGKVILITGGMTISLEEINKETDRIGNGGLGKESALQLAKHNPTEIYIGCRSTAKGNAAIADIKLITPNANIHPLELNLASFASVQSAVKRFLAASTRLDLLINNAGIMTVPAALTTDGYEIQFGTNHMGHALLTKLLLPTLLRTASLADSDVRIVNMTSSAHSMSTAEGIKFDTLRTDGKSAGEVACYGQSKLANILHAKELARRFPTIKVVAVHPGRVTTELAAAARNNHLWVRVLLLGMRIFSPASDVEHGAYGQLWAATSDEVTSGTYYVPVGKEDPGSALARNEKLAYDLWDWTETELAVYTL